MQQQQPTVTQTDRQTDGRTKGQTGAMAELVEWDLNFQLPTTR